MLHNDSPRSSRGVNPLLRAKQVWRKTDLGPNKVERQVLEAIEKTGGLLIRFRNGRLLASLADGTPLAQVGEFDIGMAIELGWLRPDPLSPALLNDMPHQRYFATGLTCIEGGQ